MDTIIYHGNCPDGFCAAFILNKIYPTASLIPATYGKGVDANAIVGKDVIIADFSWPREDTLHGKSIAKSMVILDHHKTAEAALAGLDFCVFDMNRSGAQLAWDYAFPGHGRPWYVDYVADRDLWRWQLPESKAVSAFIMALPHTIEAWSVLDDMTAEQAIVTGKGARAHIEHYVDKVSAQKYAGQWNGYSVSIVNAAYPNISDVGNVLCEQGAQVGLGWFVRGDKMVQFSLRSIGDLDVSALAAEHGGGGHKNAAGFQLPLSDGLALLERLTQ